MNYLAIQYVLSKVLKCSANEQGKYIYSQIDPSTYWYSLEILQFLLRIFMQITLACLTSGGVLKLKINLMLSMMLQTILMSLLYTHALYCR